MKLWFLTALLTFTLFAGAATAQEAIGVFSLETNYLDGGKIGTVLDSGPKILPSDGKQFVRMVDGLAVDVENTRYDRFAIILETSGSYTGPKDKVGEEILAWFAVPGGRGVLTEIKGVDMSRRKFVIYRSAYGESKVRLIYGEGVWLNHLLRGGEYSRKITFSIEPI